MYCLKTYSIKGVIEFEGCLVYPLNPQKINKQKTEIIIFIKKWDLIGFALSKVARKRKMIMSRYIVCHQIKLLQLNGKKF
jgi:hypothetical protein